MRRVTVEERVAAAERVEDGRPEVANGGVAIKRVGGNAGPPAFLTGTGDVYLEWLVSEGGAWWATRSPSAMPNWP
jgi:hypothetical protein